MRVADEQTNGPMNGPVDQFDDPALAVRACGVEHPRVIQFSSVAGETYIVCISKE